MKNIKGDKTMKPQTQEEIEVMLNQAYKNVIEKEEQDMEKQISKAWEQGQGSETTIDVHKALGGEVDTKYTGAGVLIGFVFMLFVFFMYNNIDQKNNVETIQILASENTRLRQQIEDIQNPPLSAEEIKEIKKSLGEISDDEILKILNSPKVEAKK